MSVDACKNCICCGLQKPLDAFYRHPEMADGHLNKCKECVKRAVRENRELKFEYYQAYDAARAMEPSRVAGRKAYAKTRRGKKAHRRASKAYQIANPEKRAAHVAVSNALRDGWISKRPCTVCGSWKSQAHHPDYRRELDVVWLCPAHHRARHAQAGGRVA